MAQAMLLACGSSAWTLPPTLSWLYPCHLFGLSWNVSSSEMTVHTNPHCFAPAFLHHLTPLHRLHRLITIGNYSAAYFMSFIFSLRLLIPRRQGHFCFIHHWMLHWYLALRRHWMHFVYYPHPDFILPFCFYFPFLRKNTFFKKISFVGV